MSCDFLMSGLFLGYIYLSLYPLFSGLYMFDAYNNRNYYLLIWVSYGSSLHSGLNDGTPTQKCCVIISSNSRA